MNLSAGQRRGLFGRVPEFAAGPANVWRTKRNLEGLNIMGPLSVGGNNAEQLETLGNGRQLLTGGR